MATPGGSDGAPKGEHLQPSSSTSGSTSRSSSSATNTEPISLTIRVLEDSTDNFSKEQVVGRGTYGTVYKGMLKNGEEIALKVLYNNTPEINDEQFKHEFGNLMMLNHKNIIRLVGYCYETRHQYTEIHGKHVFAEITTRVLCFEYMPMGSLQKHLYDETQALEWKIRYKIIKGICEGLEYLHNGLEKPIYHLDLKPDNILLDKNMIPKLGDFGLSKLFGEEQTRATQSTIGTFGYMPPEYLDGQLVSKKFDIFSLGVIITKIIAGPKGRTTMAEMSRQEFLDQVHENWRNKLEEMCTSEMLEANCHQVRICTDIALRCLEFDRHKRPDILEIVRKLDETEIMVEKAAFYRGGQDSDLTDMAGQLLAMLIVHGDGGIERKAWDQVQGLLARVATCVADPKITSEHMLGLLEDVGGASSLQLHHPKAEALLRRIMASLGEETIRVLDADLAIPRLREVFLVVAGQLGMLPLCDSDPMYLVDGDSNFCYANVAGIIKCSPQLSAPNAPYGVVSIIGKQSSGKSYLLNCLFGTKFPVMNAKHGRRNKTTRGIMMSRCIGPSFLVLDFEGFNGREMGQDAEFQQQATLFALTVSEVILVNMCVFDICREQGRGTLLFKTIFKERIKLPVGLTNIMVVLRMYDGETPLEILKDDVIESLSKIWKSVNMKSKFEENIKVNVVGLPHTNSREFPKEVTLLRRLLSNNNITNFHGSAKVPASTFSLYSRILWNKIKNNRKLDIPSHQEALAVLLCRHTADNTLKSVESCKDYNLLKSEESPRRFREISESLLKSIVTMYDHETEMYDLKVRDNERQYMLEIINKVFIEDSRELIQKTQRNTLEQFKGEYVKRLKNMKETDVDLPYDDRIAESCVNDFMNLCEDLKVFDSDYLHVTCADLQKDLQSYILYQYQIIQATSERKQAELTRQKYEQNVNELVKKPIEGNKENQNMSRENEKLPQEQLEYARQTLEKHQEHTENMLVRQQAQAEKIISTLQELPEKRLSAQQDRKGKKHAEQQEKMEKKHAEQQEKPYKKFVEQQEKRDKKLTAQQAEIKELKERCTIM